MIRSRATGSSYIMYRPVSSLTIETNEILDKKNKKADRSSPVQHC